MARLNGVQQLVHLEGWCSPEKLRATCPDRSLILCDCEGYETTLFTESLIRSLCHSDLIIELHDDVEIHFGTDRTVTRNDFLSRFAATHQINLITSVPRLAAECPELVKLGLLDDLLVNEFRTVGQQWAIITARSSSFL